jgi:hypothetical protein
MGTWGVDIFDDDLALDLKGEYAEILDSGLSHEATAETLAERYQNSLDDPEESGVFWLALASIQLEHHSLTKDVKVNALDVINHNRDLLRWEDSPDLQDRKKILEQLKKQLLQE